MKMMIMVVMGMVCLSMTIMPTKALDNPTGLPICWAKVDDCLTSAGLDAADPTTNYALCCPVIKPQVANATCFCSIKEYIQDVPSDQPAVLSSTFEVLANRVLGDCKFTSSFDELCNGVSKTESVSESSEAVQHPQHPGMTKNGATKIERSVYGLVPAALFFWTMIMSA
ncbi:uncharacterized protein [Spinacia oleracea]|uniref:Bifunctional inhibitor/plant lipid transfer protein/seed storage helical domain-containing protein n=1 Tax=Spinacia oleracea TaxID=3562 RepID=A0A9R0IUQ6_SPIOL|nr:uncharacterized protein LOC110795274 [Spinacia oleracea]